MQLVKTTLNDNLKQDLAQLQASNKNAFEEMCGKIEDLNGIQLVNNK